MMFTTDFQMVQLTKNKCVYVWLCVCVRAREGENEREREWREKSKRNKMLTVVKGKWRVYRVSMNYSCSSSDNLERR